MRITITLNDAQQAALKKLMQDDLQTNVSGYFAFLVAQEAKARNKPKAGRPRKDTDDEDNTDSNYTSDFPKNIPYFGEMIGPKEYADKEANRAEFMPKS